MFWSYEQFSVWIGSLIMRDITPTHTVTVRTHSLGSKITTFARLFLPLILYELTQYFKWQAKIVHHWWCHARFWVKMSENPVENKLIFRNTMWYILCGESRDNSAHKVRIHHNFTHLKCLITQFWSDIGKSLGLQTTYEQVLLTSIMVRVSVIWFHRSLDLGWNIELSQCLKIHAGVWSSEPQFQS